MSNELEQQQTEAVEKFNDTVRSLTITLDDVINEIEIASAQQQVLFDALNRIIYPEIMRLRMQLFWVKVTAITGFCLAASILFLR